MPRERVEVSDAAAELSDASRVVYRVSSQIISDRPSVIWFSLWRTLHCAGSQGVLGDTADDKQTERSGDETFRR